ncbi:MAG: hypothetical protein ACJA1U_001493 [Bermanella sp.]|jgi:hypothetical protein
MRHTIRLNQKAFGDDFGFDADDEALGACGEGITIT